MTLPTDTAKRIAILEARNAALVKALEELEHYADNLCFVCANGAEHLSASSVSDMARAAIDAAIKEKP